MILTTVLASIFLAVAIFQWRRARRLGLLLDEADLSQRDHQRRIRLLDEKLKGRKNRLQQFALMLSQMRDGVLLIGGDGRVIRVNHAAARLLNLETRIFRKPIRYNDVLRQPPLRDAIKSTIATLQTSHFELDIEVDGKWLHLDGSVERFDRDKIVGILPLAEHDADADTEESAVFEKGLPSDSMLAQAKQDSMRFVVLVRDQTERREMESMRRDLTANLSHELKTPLAAIKGYAETIDLAIDDDVEAAKHFMSQLHDQCRRMEHMIADMLQLTRVQSQDGQLRIERVDLEVIFSEAISAARILADQKSLSITLEPLQRIELSSDREALLTILNNLIGNAVRYTPQGGRVVVGAKIDRPSNRLTIHVEDNGVGISTEDQPKVFGRFFRVQRIGQADRRANAGLRGSGPSDRSGTGLGLSIVQSLTKSLGGTVGIDSELGRGSRFEVVLPIIFEDNRDGASSKFHPDQDDQGLPRIARSETISP